MEATVGRGGVGAPSGKRRVSALIALVLATAGAWSGEAQAAGWLAPTDVSQPQSTGGACGFLSAQAGVGGVQVAVNRSGETIAAWTRRDGGSQTVQVAMRPPGGVFTAPQTIGTTLPCYVLGILGATPKVAIGDQGDAVVVWPHPLSSTTVIQAAVRPAGGGFGAAVDLSDASRTANSDPDVAMAADGTAVATWSWSTGAHTVVQVAARPAGGAFAPAGTAQTLSNSSQDASGARVALDDGGAAAVVWTRSDGAHAIAQASVRPAGGAFAAAVNLSAAGADASAADVAIDPQGRATAVWIRANLVESRFLTAQGALDGGVDDVSDVAESVSFPSIALDADNNAVVVWTGGSLTKAAARASRASFGPPQTISSPGDSNALPTVAMDAAGTAVAVWSQGLQTIQSARRPRGGSFGAVEDVSAPPGAGVIPSLALDGEGSAVVGWTSLRPAPDNREVAQVSAFDAGAPTLTDVAVPAAAAAGQPVAMSASATDRWSAATITWAFGDGTSASGPSAAHTYTAAATATVTITATDAAGNLTSTQRAIAIVNPAPAPLPAPRATAPPTAAPAAPAAKPPARVRVTVLFRYAATRRSTKLTRFTIRHVPPGSTIRVTCRPPKRHGKRPKCPARTFHKSRAKGSVSIKTFLHRRFARNTQIQVRVTRPGRNGAVKLLRIRTRNGPSIATRCLPPGARRPTRCSAS